MDDVVTRASARRAAGAALVGRDDELGALEAHWERALAGNATTVLLGGDAGVGKTTVVDAFLDAHRNDALVVRGPCIPLGGDGLAYVPIVAILRELQQVVGAETMLGWAGPAAPALGALLPDVAPRPDAPLAPSRTLELAAEIFEHAGKRGPLIVVVEDIHWADASTRDLLSFTVRALRDVPVLIVATYRTDELHRRHPLRPFLAELDRLPQVSHVDLDRFDRAGVAALLADILPEPPAPAEVDEIYERSDGIAFFVVELAGYDCCSLPDGLRNVLLVRFETLGAAAQATVRVAAVAGAHTDHGLLELVSDLDPAELAAAVREAVDRQLLVADDRGYTFRHALLREAVLEDLLPGEAAALHRRFAETLELKDDLLPDSVRAVRLAHHWYHGHDRDRAFRWTLAAARLPSAGPGEALRWFELALELWPQVSDPESVYGGSKADLLSAASMAAGDAGDPARAMTLVDAALAVTDAELDPLAAARLLMRKGHLLSKLLRPGGVATLEQAVALVPPEPPTQLRAEVLSTMAALQMMSGYEQESIVTATEAIAAADAAGAPLVAAEAYITRGTSTGDFGGLDDALADFATARRLADGDERTYVRTLINLSDTLRLNGRYEDAYAEAISGMDGARALGLERTWGAMLAGNAAEPLLMLGRWDEALTLIEQALDLTPSPSHRLHLRVLRATHAILTGNLPLADRLLAEFRPQLDVLRSTPQYLAVVATAEVAYALAVGDPRRAWQVASQVFDHRTRMKPDDLWWIATRAAEAIGSIRRAGGSPPPGAAELVVTVAAELGAASPNDAARLLVAAELSASAPDWASAAAALGSREGPVHLVPYAWFRQAEALAATDRPAAVALLREAGERAAALGAAPLVDSITDLTERLGAATVVPGRSAAALTPRELDVLRLVAAGMSNGDIGHRLFISTKTASVHVSNILAKLGVANRVEAAALAHRTNLV